jgi:hypothetical protein
VTLLTVWELDHAFAVALETADARRIGSANASHLQIGQSSVHGRLMSSAHTFSLRQDTQATGAAPSRRSAAIVIKWLLFLQRKEISNDVI